MKTSHISAFGAMLVQFGVVMMVYVSALLPHLHGTEIALEVVPRDPRSVFRGNYARLRLNEHDIKVHTRDNEEVCPYTTVYVPLKKDGVFYRGTEGQLDKPKEGLFLRGLAKPGRCRSASPQVSVEYGLEAYFAPRAEAERIDQEVRRGRFQLDIMVAPNGQAAIKSLRVQEDS